MRNKTLPKEQVYFFTVAKPNCTCFVRMGQPPCFQDVLLFATRRMSGRSF